MQNEVAELKLVIGDKRYSSWSLRPWLVLRQAGLPFREIRIRLRQPDTMQQVLKHSPSGKVPLLKDGGLAVWDSLAICEYLADRFPARNLWPSGVEARARARSIAAEMHAGFPDLRQELSMDMLTVVPTPQLSAGAARDVERVQAIWRECRAQADGGPFLFGAFTIADAFYAPVVSRFVTYNIAVDPVSHTYMDAVLALPAMQEWQRDAKAEDQLNS